MRQVIRGNAYDTETATEIARGDHGEDGESVYDRRAVEVTLDEVERIGI